MNTRLQLAAVSAALIGILACDASLAQQAAFTEDFTGASTNNNWYYFNGACLTAGTSAGTGSPGKVPSCTSIATSYYAAQQDNDPVLVGGATGTLPDPVGNGALRFTNGRPYGHGENGAIVSASTFNAGQGVHITFKAVTYRGDSGGAGKDGADGMSFYLLDATTQTPGNGIWNGIGSWGGSLAYTCSNANPPYNGLVAGYLGLGIDEFGNFLNGVVLEPGYAGAAASGDNTALGYGYLPGRIGLRGYGSVSWAYLNATYPADYPSALTSGQQQAAVQKTCKSGTLWNYSVPSSPVNTGTAIPDYAPILNAYSVLSGVQIANEAANTRPNGTTSQNVFFYDLKITQDGLLSLAYSMNGGAYTNVIKNQNITTSNGALPATLQFGFAGSTGGDTNVHEILCFKAEPVAVSASSAAGDEKLTSEVQETSQAYFAYYNPNNFTGTVTAYPLVDTAGILTLANLANWDAQCVLTGVGASGTCATTGVAGPSAAQPWASGSGNSRVMLTWNGLDTAAAPGNAGISFEWASLTATEQSTLDAGDATATAKRLNYLRGERANEINTAGVGLFRARGGVLGDIVDSSPTWVGPPNAPYVLTWKDNLYPGTAMPENSGQSYLTFETAEQSRLNVVYVGANDGFLHGVRSGSEDSAGDVISNATTPNDGLEVLAYMPGAVLNTIHNSANASLDFANTQYAHSFDVDATPGAGDLFYGGAWHTWLVGGLGPGGAAIYALEVTNPTTTTFTEANASTIVKGEWSSATITCANVAACGNNLGNTYGTPAIRRLHNGTWGAIFGNGYGSGSGDAGIYVMTLNPATAAATFYYLSTGKAGGNGIAYVAPADLDGDHITDYVYAGDLKGNVWRFDLTSNNPASWAVTSGPLFQTAAGQPITTQMVLASAVISGSSPQLIIGFGTGERTQFTATSGVQYQTGTQSLYGVWDWNMASWNTKNTAASYASLTGAQVGGATGTSSPYTLGPSNLQKQTFTPVSGGVDTSNTTITWEQCTPGCNAGKFGWYANLPATLGATNGAGAAITEQIVSSPSFYQGAFIVNSTIPASALPLSCATPLTDQGVLYVLSVVSGTTFVASGSSSSSPTFASAFVNYHDSQLAGLSTNETGAVTVVNTVEGTTWVIGQDIAPPAAGTAAPGQTTQINLPLNTSTNRVTWIELR
ncbi:MAG TPA: PilC/PilY family type IV pilus protein [Steroidobacteraceae bacterium]|nr:PilC/PilY family type IV pilus protein [Steroidobacteraceae bacterium]